MLPPYKMVAVNLIAALILLLGILFYQKIYPKKKVNPLILLLLLSLLPLNSLLRPGVYESGDFTINVAKSMSFYQSLLEGHLIPRWAGELNATYGYPLFLFTYPLPYFIISLFHFVGFSFINSLKFLIAASFVASGFAMYFWIKEEFNKTSALVAAIFYLYAPYHLVDTHFRISIGEIVSFALLPLSLLFVKKLITNGKLKWLYLESISLALLLLCNPAISLISFAFLGIYALFIWLQQKKRKLKSLLFCFLAIVFGLLLSAFYWLPVNTDLRYTHEAQYVQTIQFVQLPELLYSPWRYGLLFQGHKGELSYVIGYIQLLVILLAIIFLVRKTFAATEKRKTLFYLIALLITIFLMLPYSKFIWDALPILHNFQFTYRLLLFAAIFTSILAGIIVTKINKKLIILLCVLAILQTILNWGNRRTIPEITDAVIQKIFP